MLEIFLFTIHGIFLIASDILTVTRLKRNCLKSIYQKLLLINSLSTIIMSNFNQVSSFYLLFCLV